MKPAIATLVAMSGLALLAGCSQTDAPSQEVEQAAHDVVSAVDGSGTPHQLAAGPYAPRDDCSTLAGAEDFLADLRSAIDTRDAAALIGLAAEDVKLDFGGGSGTAELGRRLNDPKDALWDNLVPLPDLGCFANAQGGITLPWFVEQPIVVENPGDGFIVTGEGVPVYDAPGKGAPVAARLSWEAVEQVRDGADIAGYRHVRVIPAPDAADTPAAGPATFDPITGYVAENQLRSLLAYRLTAASRNGRWRIISIVSGD